ncbi:hypothetical protein [Streptomyces sp. bgisy100]|uniref:hypothetical protein n=1 Tax=Streptomyces sp. bgisy100 TaxID=3413783 RepID=UPI003D74FAED
MDPLTEHRTVNGPIVYGFLRLPQRAAARQTALTGALVEYCHSHELVLGAIFIERDSTATASSTAFTGLLDVLDLPDVYGVVLPAPSHLGPKPIAVERRLQITGSGVRLILARGSRTIRRTSDRCRRSTPSSAPTVDTET